MVVAAELLDPFDSANYWRQRYRAGGNSGSGAYGRLAVYKAHVVNLICATRRIRSVIEFGSGDGNQARLFSIPNYLGVDVASEGLEIARTRLADRRNWRFKTLDEFAANPEQADLALSLDVIYHLVEDEVFEAYMQRLFRAAARFVLIYSSDHHQAETAPHVLHRHYSAWIKKEVPDWRPIRTLKQPFPFRPGANPRTTSFAFFRLFQRAPSAPAAS